jgi:hypothetical protein
MDRLTHDRVRDEAILRAQDRASLRKPTHTSAGSPYLGVSASRDEGPREQPRLSVMGLRSTFTPAELEGR